MADLCFPFQLTVIMALLVGPVIIHSAFFLSLSQKEIILLRWSCTTSN